MVIKELVVATNNRNKLREIKGLIGNEIKLYSLSDLGIDIDINEDADTFLGNAMIKARAVAQLTNMPSLADDSGLEVLSLNNRPGVFSARYANIGEGKVFDNSFDKKSANQDDLNIDKLLKEMNGLKNRSARFVCSLVLYFPNNKYISVEEYSEGKILESRCGSNGFGYDPVFYSKDLSKCFGDASQEEKDSVSHRARALKSMVAKIKATLG